MPPFFDFEIFSVVFLRPFYLDINSIALKACHLGGKGCMLIPIEHPLDVMGWQQRDGFRI